MERWAAGRSWGEGWNVINTTNRWTEGQEDRTGEIIIPALTGSRALSSVGDIEAVLSYHGSLGSTVLHCAPLCWAARHNKRSGKMTNINNLSVGSHSDLNQGYWKEISISRYTARSDDEITMINLVGRVLMKYQTWFFHFDIFIFRLVWSVGVVSVVV